MTRATSLSKEPVTLVRMHELLQLTGLARPTVYKLIKRDPNFPQPVKLTDSSARNAPVAFVRSEILAWIQSRIQNREQHA